MLRDVCRAAHATIEACIDGLQGAGCFRGNKSDGGRKTGRIDQMFGEPVQHVWLETNYYVLRKTASRLKPDRLRPSRRSGRPRLRPSQGPVETIRDTAESKARGR